MRDNRLKIILPAGALVLLLLGTIIGLSGIAQADIPPRPASGAFVNDFGGLIHREDMDRIGQVQKTSYEQYDTPIVVVTIPSMSTYGFQTPNIESFARYWFDTWGIGKSAQAGENKGILLLVSVGDRKARIELGADWGRDWDEYCQNVMDSTIIPEFKKGNYSGGIADGVAALGQIAAAGPGAEAPNPNALESVVNKAKSGKPLTKLSPIPGGIGMLLIGFSILFFILGLALPQYRKAFFITAAVLLSLALFLYLLLFILALFSKGRRSGGFGGGGFSSGGGFGGGFSGGGGASGGW